MLRLFHRLHCDVIVQRVLETVVAGPPGQGSDFGLKPTSCPWPCPLALGLALLLGIVDPPHLEYGFEPGLGPITQNHFNYNYHEISTSITPQ